MTGAPPSAPASASSTGPRPSMRRGRPVLAVDASRSAPRAPPRCPSCRRPRSARRARGSRTPRRASRSIAGSVPGCPVSGSEVAITPATWRATSKFTGPCDCSMRISCEKSKPPGNGKPGPIWGTSLTRQSMDRGSHGIASRSPASPVSSVSACLPLLDASPAVDAHHRPRRARSGPPGAEADVPPARHPQRRPRALPRATSTPSCTSPRSSGRSPTKA